MRQDHVGSTGSELLRFLTATWVLGRGSPEPKLCAFHLKNWVTVLVALTVRAALANPWRAELQIASRNGQMQQALLCTLLHCECTKDR